ncbi:MAG: MAPEG family protein [Pseudomonadota bacterium]
MSIELWMLLAGSVMVASLWMPFVIGVNLHLPASQEPGLRPPDTTLLPDWVQRANRAHLNLVEQFAPFAALVLTIELTGLSSALTGIAAMAFIVLRAAHAVGYITAMAQIPVRPIIFTAAWLCLIVMAVDVGRLALFG